MNYTAKMRRQLERSRGLTEYDATRLEAAADAHREAGLTRCDRCGKRVGGTAPLKDGSRGCAECYGNQRACRRCDGRGFVPVVAADGELDPADCPECKEQPR